MVPPCSLCFAFSDASCDKRIGRLGCSASPGCKASLEERILRSPSMPEAASEAFSGVASLTLRRIFQIAVDRVIGPAFTL